MLRIFLTIVIILINQEVDSSLQCKFLETINITDGYKDSSQNFIYKGDAYPLGTYQEFNYVENYKHEKTDVDPHIRGCVCKLKTCIRLCCRGDEVENRIPNCYDTNTFTVKNEKGEDEIINIGENKYGILVGRPCDAVFPLEVEEQWKFLKNGSFYFVDEDTIYDTNNFCFGITNNSEAQPYVCFQDHNYTLDGIDRFDVYPIGMLISIPFLIITFFVYAYIPELRNLHGKCLMGYTFSLTVLYTVLAINQSRIFGSYLGINCAAMGYFTYFAVFLCFFWMNIMCYDIWNISRKGVSIRSAKEEHKKFTSYCLYAVGIPTCMTLIVIIIDKAEPFDTTYLPLIGDTKCWIQPLFIVEAIYVYIPISIIIIINIIFFTNTSQKIWKAQRASVEDDARKRKRILRRRFSIYLRLFILMGMMWCMESISWIYRDKFKYFYVTDFFNCIQGLLIFLICVCDARTRHLILRRCCSSRTSNEESVTYAVDFGITDDTMKMTDTK